MYLQLGVNAQRLRAQVSFVGIDGSKVRNWIETFLLRLSFPFPCKLSFVQPGLPFEKHSFN